MNEHDESVGRLELVGYEKLTDNGLALPLLANLRELMSFIQRAPQSSVGLAGTSLASINTIQRPLYSFLVSRFGKPELESCGSMYFCGTTSLMPEPLQRFGTLSQTCANELRSIHLSAG